MKLNVQERLTLVNLLPEKGNFATMKIIEGVRDLLYPSEEESKQFEIKQSGNNISWNAEGSKEIEIKLSKGQRDLLEDSLGKLDESEELTFAHYTVFKKFKK